MRKREKKLSWEPIHLTPLLMPMDYWHTCICMHLKKSGLADGTDDNENSSIAQGQGYKVKAQAT